MAPPNVTGTTNADVIAQRALEMLVARLPFLGQISTDFSNEPVKFGARVITHIVTAAAAVNFDPSVGYVPSARTQVDVPVPLDKHKHHTYGVSVQEASSSQINLIERYATTASYSIGAALVADLLGLVVADDFANATQIALGENEDGFNRRGVIRVGKALGKRGVPPMGRFMLLNPDFYASLGLDNQMLVALLQAGAQTIQTGVLPNVHSFDISEFVDFPTNDEDLAGIAGTRDALCLVTRIPDDPGQGQSNVRISTVTEPQTGISVQVREWYEPTLAQFRRTYTLMYGVAKGQAASLQRIVQSDAAEESE